MKSFRARIEVKLKAGYLDPEGETVKGALSYLGYSVSSVGTSRVYEIRFSAASKEEARRIAEEMCRRLLSNPVKDEYSFEITEEG
ncbi:MAG: phosphoribosylformylglycinamidine synthase subunit PurS [Candidatus Hadarchaeales archaeon]